MLKNKTVKKVVKKVEKLATVAKKAVYNEFGTCIACQDGKVECLHNNLVQNGQDINCLTCGQKM